MKAFLFNLRLLLILIFLSQNVVSSQKFIVFEGDTINRIDVNRKKQGLWINFDASGKRVVEKGNYLNNKKVGVWVSYFSNGNVKHEITFKGGVANGPAKFYYENGTVWEQGIWMIDHWIGKYQFFYPSGQIAYDWNYNTVGKRNGAQKYYHENGNVKYAGKWTNGKTTGALKVYDESGNLSSERLYAEGKFTQSISYGDDEVGDASGGMSASRFSGSGHHTIYNLSGKIEKKGYFEKGKLIDGEQRVYSSDGVLSSVLIFEGGELKQTKHHD